MLELLLCSAVTVLPDFLYRRYGQGKRLGREINLFSVWYELRWGITLCVILTLSLITTIFYFHPSTSSAVSVFRTVTILPEVGAASRKPMWASTSTSPPASLSSASTRPLPKQRS